MSSELQIFLNENKFTISHNVNEIKNLSENVLLSVNYRKVKELLKFTRHKQFYKFCEDNGLLFRITELVVTNLDFDKSFLDVLKMAFDDKLIEEIKKKGIQSVVLHATPYGRPLYEKYGFRENNGDKEMILKF